MKIAVKTGKIDTEKRVQKCYRSFCKQSAEVSIWRYFTAILLLTVIFMQLRLYLKTFQFLETVSAK